MSLKETIYRFKEYKKEIKKGTWYFRKSRKEKGILVLTSALLLVQNGCGKAEEEEGTTAEVLPVTYETFEETIAELPSSVTLEDGTVQELSLTLWYDDEKEAPYYEAAAVEFHNRYGVKVVCEYQSSVDYLDSINRAQIKEQGPDVFITSNDQLRKAYLAGLTEKNALYTDEFWAENYPVVAKQAFSTDGKQVGYPIYLDTCMMIYDTTLTEQPHFFTDITEFAVNFEDEENQKVLFRFDISDPYSDYLFLGDGAKVFGAYGDDTTVFDISNSSVIENMTYYQSLREYFSLEVDTSTYEQIMNELSDGTLVYGIVKTDVLPELTKLGSQYALCPVPELSDTLSTQVLSTTYGAFVSSYTDQPEYANLFAAFLSYCYAENSYALAKRVAVRSTLSRADANEACAYEQYTMSVPTPKVLENGDFWIYMEICFKHIWNGEDVAEEMQKLQSEMAVRLE